ncbi:MAG: FHA domain-containing protein [Cyanobacteria bacterium SBLK]|nr:FHA domain-containing protein [Cyanobacteria bacterium SBLK]
MRTYLYILAGITSALIGWNIGQLFLTDLGILQPFPEIVLFPCIAISLAVGMVLNEIFISSPTRPKLCFRKVKIPLLIALGLGLLAGLISGGISQILFHPAIRVPTPVVRSLGWLFIGSSVGIAEGWTWRWQTVEAGDRKRFRKRLQLSIISASSASLFAALLFELLRLPLGEMPKEFRGAEDPIGFLILGLLLGLAFSISNSPSYMAALRAGTGFEVTENDLNPYETIASQSYPSIEQPLLKFVSNSEENKIEEGLSIQLPDKGKLRIGSAPKANIHIPDLPLHSADIDLQHRGTILTPNPRFFFTIEINGDRVSSKTPIRLKHNDVLTFYGKTEDEFDTEAPIYRFVYYNRFLDPQA